MRARATGLNRANVPRPHRNEGLGRWPSVLDKVSTRDDLDRHLVEHRPDCTRPYRPSHRLRNRWEPNGLPPASPAFRFLPHNMLVTKGTNPVDFPGGDKHHGTPFGWKISWESIDFDGPPLDGDPSDGPPYNRRTRRDLTERS